MEGSKLASPAFKGCCRSRGDKGSMTLEAAIILPWIMLLTFLLILLAVYVMNRSTHYYSVSVTAARTAFAWPHSSANLKTGGYPDGGYDGLYWRLKDDALLAGLFGWGAGDGEAAVKIGGGPYGGSSRDLIESKLYRAAAALPDGMEGKVAYRNRIGLREVTINATGTASPDPLRQMWPSFGRGASATVSAVVNEPAEWVRTFQLARYYLARLRQDGDDADRLRRRAAALPGGKG